MYDDGKVNDNCWYQAYNIVIFQKKVLAVFMVFICVLTNLCVVVYYKSKLRKIGKKVSGEKIEYEKVNNPLKNETDVSDIE